MDNFSPDSFPVLKTSRLVLRTATPADAAAVFAIFADDEVTRYHDLATFTTLEEASGVIQRRAKRFVNGHGFRWGLVRKEDDRFVGSCGFGAWDKEARSAEIGYELGRQYWRQGIMTEALTVILSFGFEQMRLQRVVAEVMLDNVASIRLLEKLGFKDEGILRQEGYWKGQYHDLRRFSLDREIWWSRTGACYSCLSNSAIRRISPGPTIFEGDYWLIEHAYPCGIKGWLVLVLKRHAEALHELTTAEFAESGVLLGRTASILHAVSGSEKEYAMCLAEVEHFKHIHFHVVAKPIDLPEELKGTRIFAMLKVSEQEAVPKEEVKAFCELLRDRFTQAGYGSTHPDVKETLNAVC